MRQKTIVAVLLLVANLVAGCATERTVSPTIESKPRVDLELRTPVLASAYDGRTSGSEDAPAETLERELSRLYGRNLEWVPYFEETPDGRVSIKYRIVTLGAEFGSRLVSAASYASAVQTAQVSIPRRWNPIFVSGVSSASVQAATFSGEGWWNGAAWVDIEVEDHRDGANARFTIPLVAEHRESNIWGYTSGDKAAKTAWQKVAGQITRITDAILRKTRDDEG